MLHDEALSVVTAGGSAAEETRRGSAREQPLDFGLLRFLIAGDVGKTPRRP
jgi:hypothetical protein